MDLNWVYGAHFVQPIETKVFALLSQSNFGNPLGQIKWVFLMINAQLKHIRNLLLVRGFIFVLIESYFVLPKNLLKYLVTTLWRTVPPNHLTNKIYSIVYTYCVMIYINIQLKFSWKLTFFFSGRYFTVCEYSRLTSAASWVPPPYWDVNLPDFRHRLRLATLVPFLYK